MKIGIFSDVHANLPALEAVLKSMHEEKIESYVFLGDAVGYGADPETCMKIIENTSEIILLGNHDSVAAGKEPSDGFNFFAKQSILWTQNRISSETRSLLLSLPYTAELENCLFVHSSPDYPELWKYVLSLDDAVISMDYFKQDICFIGHTHIPGIFVQTGINDVYVAESLRYQFQPGQEKLLVNVGSVGQPRDRIPLASWCLFDSSKNNLEIIRVAYEVNKSQDRMRKAGLPDFLIRRLEDGR